LKLFSDKLQPEANGLQRLATKRRQLYLCCKCLRTVADDYAETAEKMVGWNPAPNLCNSAPQNRCELLRKGAESSPYCSQSYQFHLVEVISQVHQIGRQFDSRTWN
jgi:hypothetical protein